MGLDVILDFFDQFIRRLLILGKNDVRLDDLSAGGIRNTDDSTFQHIGQFHDDGFNFKRSDTVAGGLDQIVSTSDIPEVTVFIAPGSIAGVVVAVVLGIRGGFGITVTDKQSGNLIGFGFDNKFTDFAGFDRIAVGIVQFHVVQRGNASH